MTQSPANHIIEAIHKFTGRHGNPDKTPFTAALIDMDGTLYDSMPFHARAWKKMCDLNGLDSSTDDFFGYEGMTGRQTVEEVFRRNGLPLPDDETVARLYALKSEFFNSQRPVNPFPGARKMLSYLISHRISRVLVTGSGQFSLISRLENDFPGAFCASTMITSRDVTHGKPSPEPYIRAMALCGAPPHRCVVIENAPLGIKSGKAAGAFVIALATGPIAADTLRDAGAHVVLSSMTDLANNISLFFPSPDVSPANG